MLFINFKTNFRILDDIKKALFYDMTHSNTNGNKRPNCLLKFNIE